MWKEDAVGDGWFCLVMLHSGEATDPANELKLCIEDDKLVIGKVEGTPDRALWKWSGNGAWKYLDAKTATNLRPSRQPDGTAQAKVDNDWSAQWRKRHLSPLQ